MERFRQPNLVSAEPRNSVYSTDSLKNSIYSEYTEGTSSTISHPPSYAPSYMNAAIPSRKPVTPSRPTTQPVELPATEAQPSATAQLEKGVLLLVIATSPHPSTLSYLELMLKLGSYCAITIVGDAEHEAELKQLKMNIYALLGKMSLEVGVQLELQKSWSESDISAVVAKALKAGDPLYGVLCSPAYENSLSTKSDVLGLDATGFESLWKLSVAFLRDSAKLIIPHMRPSKYDQPGKYGLFVVTEPKELSATASVYKAACDRLIRLLAESNARGGITVAYADDVLIPEPEPKETNGRLYVSTNGKPRDRGVEDFPAEESPTELWNMWALQDELGSP